MSKYAVLTWVFVLACGGSDGAQGPEGAAGAMGDKGDKGDKGDQGDIGADGQLRIYGDGSAGALVVAASGTLFVDVAANGNAQFTDLTINAGVTLVVPSGVTIRCTGTFTNNGNIDVELGAFGGSAFANNTLQPGVLPQYMPAHPGAARRLSATGELGDATGNRSGGVGGLGLLARAYRTHVHPGAFGGGGGASSLAQNGGGGFGGGSFVVLAGTAIVNAGSIFALGDNAPDPGGGGGGGGFVVLASRGAVSHTGSILVRGGNGGAAGTATGPGGGGGGGVVHLLAPTITATGTSDIAGGTGTAAQAAGTVTGAVRSGGGGGGGGAGAGGSGAQVLTTGATGIANGGQAGVSLQTQVDPTSLF